MIMTWQEQIQKLQVTPDKPGVYLLKDPIDSILYVGKASNLKTRLRHYFASPSKLEGKQKYLIKKISDFDYVVTSSETEALILENIYIKRYKPHYNIRLKDDKMYFYIKIDLNENFP
jgi:excinuclease ABC subunit C